MKTLSLDRRWIHGLLSVGFAGMLIHCDEPMDAANELDELVVDEAPVVDDMRAPAVPEGEEIVVFEDGPMDRTSGAGPAAVAEECVSWGYCVWRADDGQCIWMMSCNTSLSDFEESHCNEECGWGLLD